MRRLRLNAQLTVWRHSWAMPTCAQAHSAVVEEAWRKGADTARGPNPNVSHVIARRKQHKVAAICPKGTERRQQKLGGEMTAIEFAARSGASRAQRLATWWLQLCAQLVVARRL